jgi:hypothetical protein
MSGIIGGAAYSAIAGATGTANSLNSNANSFAGAIEQEQMQNEMNQSAQDALRQQGALTILENEQTVEEKAITTGAIH